MFRPAVPYPPTYLSTMLGSSMSECSSSWGCTSTRASWPSLVRGGGSGGELKTEECIAIGVGPRVILRVGHSVGRGFGGRWYW